MARGPHRDKGVEDLRLTNLERLGSSDEGVGPKWKDAHHIVRYEISIA